MPGRIETSPQMPRAAPGQMRDRPGGVRRGLAVDEDRMLPGTMGNGDGDPRSTAGTSDQSMKINAERTAYGFVPEDRRSYHYSHSGSALPVQSSKPVPTPRVQSSTGVMSERPPTTLGVAWAANSAPRPRQTADTAATTPQPSSVEERLRNLMMDNNQRAAKPVAHQYDDGELLLPPPPSREFGDGVTLGGLAANQADAPRPLDQSLDGGSVQNIRDHASQDQGYVPSKPSDRRQGPRAETMLQHEPSRSQMDPSARANPSHPGGQYTNFAYVPESQAPPAYGQSVTHGTAQKASDLRSAWNKLYGAVPAEWRPVSRPDVTSSDVPGMRSGTDRPSGQNDYSDYKRSTSAATPDFRRRTSHPSILPTATRQGPVGQVPSVPRQSSLGQIHPDLQEGPLGPIPSIPRESPMGQSSSTYGQTSGSSSSHRSSYSAPGTTFSTFKPDPSGDEESDGEEEKELGTLGMLGPASKYPESSSSRPSSARLTPQTPTSFHSPSFGLREMFPPSSRPSVLSRSDVRHSPRGSPRGPTPLSARTTSRDSLNQSRTGPAVASPGGASNSRPSSRLDGVAGGVLATRPPSGARVNPAFAADSGDDVDAGSSPRGGDGLSLGGGVGGGGASGSVGGMGARSHSSDRIDPADSVFDYNRRSFLRGMSESSSNRSVTPPLPPLSPSSSQPGSDPSSPRGGGGGHSLGGHSIGVNPNRPHSAMGFPVSSSYSHQRSRSALASPKTPDLLVTSTTPVPADDKRGDGGKGAGNGHPERAVNQRLSVPDRRGNSRTFYNDEPYGSNRYFARSRSLDDVRESGTESNNLSFDVDNTMLTVEPSDLSELEPSLLHGSHGGAMQPNARALRGQLHKLETMYHDVMKRMGAEKTHGKSGRRWSIASSETSSLKRGRHLRGSSSSSRPYGKDLRSIQRRFQRLESHVVTLARSLAHLSSELRAQNSVKRDLEQVKRDLRDLKQHGVASKDGPASQIAPFDKFRGWIPSLTNPKRINKLTQFFGEEPPLLKIFLNKLGYERYAKNFAAEHIGMIELPYMTEERLESIGIPMGPRLRILQEAQLCFRQENFDIYIV